MKRFFFSLALSLVALVTYAAEIPVPQIQCGPWVVGVTENEMTIMWITTERSMGWVELAPDDGTSFYAEERPRYYEDYLGRHTVTKVHKVRVAGLKAGTTYRYRIYQQGIDDSGHNPVAGRITASNVYSAKPYAIKTMDKSAKECRFSMVNDIHGRDSMLIALTKNIKKDRPDFMVFNGDMVDFMGSQKDLEDKFLKRSSELFATDIPLVYVRGNHETRGPGFSEYLNLFPTNTGTACFTFRQGPLAVIVLDSGEDKPDSDLEYGGTAAYDAYREQLASWLKQAIQSEDIRTAPVKIALLHVPFEKGKGWYGSNELKRLFVPILNEAGVDLMLSGHTHNYGIREKGTCDGNEFPILVNDNDTRMDVVATEKEISVKVIDALGKELHNLKFEVK